MSEIQPKHPSDWTITLQKAFTTKERKDRKKGQEISDSMSTHDGARSEP
jgi:hypothetical protein